jgi:hypothetical protein
LVAIPRALVTRTVVWVLSTDQPTTPREGVEHDAAVDLALPCRVLGDVGHPQLIEPVASELAPDEVQRGDLRQACALGQTARRQALESDLAHDRPDRVVADDDVAAGAQLGAHPLVAIGASGGLVDVGDLAGPPDPPQGARRVWPVLPVVVARL